MENHKEGASRVRDSCQTNPSGFLLQLGWVGWAKDRMQVKVKVKDLLRGRSEEPS